MTHEKEPAKDGAIHLKKQHIAVIVLGMVGVILFWRGVWEISAQLFSSQVSLGIGIVLLAVTVAIGKKFALKVLG